MAHRNEILNFINEYLNISEFEDYCVNGLQVEGKENINRIVFGVSVSQRLFHETAKINGDMIIVHHGLFWKSDPTPFSLTGILKKRLELLIKNDINLAAYHLPLDAHSEVGNNAQIMKKLEINNFQQVDLGFLGKLNSKTHRDEFIKIVNSKIGTTAQLFPFGPEKIQHVLAVSGGSSSMYQLAVQNNADIFIGGDIKENIVRELEEVGLNYINAGHYNSEKLGVRALSQIVRDKFDVICDYIDIPNPV